MSSVRLAKAIPLDVLVVPDHDNTETEQAAEVSCVTRGLEAGKLEPRHRAMTSLLFGRQELMGLPCLDDCDLDPSHDDADLRQQAAALHDERTQSAAHIVLAGHSNDGLVEAHLVRQLEGRKWSNSRWYFDVAYTSR